MLIVALFVEIATIGAATSPATRPVGTSSTPPAGNGTNMTADSLVPEERPVLAAMVAGYNERREELLGALVEKVKAARRDGPPAERSQRRDWVQTMREADRTIAGLKARAVGSPPIKRDTSTKNRTIPACPAVRFGHTAMEVTTMTIAIGLASLILLAAYVVVNEIRLAGMRRHLEHHDRHLEHHDRLSEMVQDYLEQVDRDINRLDDRNGRVIASLITEPSASASQARSPCSAR